jgi:AcrR family transcriptional regulator
MVIHYLSSVTPRPRTVSDDDILAATARAMSKVPPTRFTLADVAREVGLAPATLVQRFGSKRGLLLALSSQSAASMDACFDAVRQAHASPLEALLSAATEMARFSATPEELANSLAYLQIDLSDEDFHKHILASSRAMQRGYRALLDDAVAARELRPCDTDALARAVEAMAGGSLIGWAIHRKGKAETWVRRDLETLLAPYRRRA